MKKQIIFSCFMVLGLFMYNCSDDDVSFIEIFPNDIEFVDLNGLPLESGTCIDPALVYGIKIKVLRVGEGRIDPTDILFTVNGENHTTTFTDQEEKIVPINLISGENVAEIVDTFLTDMLFITEPILTDFEEVL